MTQPNKQKDKKSDLVQDWLDRSALNAIQMSEYENFRQLVSVRATNWGKHIQAKSDARIDQQNAPFLDIE